MTKKNFKNFFFFFKFQGSTGVAVEVMPEVDQDPGTTIVVVIPRDQNLLLIELSSALLIIYNFFPVSFVTFILFLVFSFWSLLSTKLRKYKTITQSLLKFCKARWARWKKNLKENCATKVNKIPKTKSRKYEMNETFF